jgi:hypothetical protein
VAEVVGVLVAVLLSGLLGVWLYVAINIPDTPAPLRVLRSGLLRLPKGEKLVGCPWCLGFWAAGGAFLWLSAFEIGFDLGVTPVGWLASAGVTGLLGMWTD